MRYALVAILLLVSLPLLAGKKDKDKDPPRLPILEYKAFQSNIFKISPSFYGPKIKGATLAYETGLWSTRFTAQLSARYFGAVDSLEVDAESPSVPANGRFELQLRLWPRLPFDGLFISGLVNYNTLQDAGYGGVIGYQHFINQYLTAEAHIGFQSKTAAEAYFDSPIIPRYGLSLGFFIGRRQLGK